MALNQSQIVDQLKKILPSDSWPWVFAAIRVDSLVWDSLQEPLETFGKADLAEFINKADDCSPAALALKALHHPSDPQTLRKSPDKPGNKTVPNSISNKPVTVVNNLCEAGQQALDFREYRLKAGSWSELGQNLACIPTTTLACLFGIIPDRQEMLKYMSVGENLPDGQPQYFGEIFQKVLHVIFSNPAPKKEQISILYKYCNDLPLALRVSFIENLFKMKPSYVKELSQLIKIPFFDKTKLNPDSTNDYISMIDQLDSTTKILHIIDQGQQESSTISKTIKIIRQLHARLTAQQAITSIRQQDTKTALVSWEQSVQYDPEAAYILPMYLFTLMDNGQAEEASKLINQYVNIHNQTNSLLLSFIRILLNTQNNSPHKSLSENRNKLYEVGDQVFDCLKNEFSWDLPNADLFDLSIKIALSNELFQQFSKLQLWKQAAQSLSLLQQLLPENAALLAMKSLTYHIAGDYIEAANQAQFVTCFAPENVKVAQFYANNCIASQNWPEASQEWQKINAKQPISNSNDLYSLAACLLNTGHEKECIEVCQKLIELDDRDGIAYAFMGTATDALGDHQGAESYLKKSVLLTPLNPFPWLALSRVQQKNGLLTESVESLQSGLTSLPSSPELSMAYGDALVRNNATTQALAEYRKAYEYANRSERKLIPSQIRSFKDWNNFEINQLPDEFDLRFNTDWLSSDISQTQFINTLQARLGETLSKLGHHNEALQILEEAHLEYPENPVLANLYGRILLRLKEFPKALAVLRHVTNKNIANPEPYLNQARCLVEWSRQLKGLNAKALQDGQEQSIQVDQGNFDETIDLLDRVLNLDAANEEAKILLAELLNHQGNYERAFNLFNEIMDGKIAKDAEWKDRIALGVSQAAMNSQRGEIAIAVLLESDQNNPEILKSLAVAYHSMHLDENAYQTAKKYLAFTPDDINQIDWFSLFVQSLDNNIPIIDTEGLSESIAALSIAVKTVPHRGDLRSRLGQLQIKNQQSEAARQTLLYFVNGQSQRSLIEATTADLLSAGKNLLLLGEAQAATTCLETAIQQNHIPFSSKNQGDEPPLLDLLNELAKAYRQSNRLELALQSFDQALLISPHDIPLQLAKVDLLLEIEGNKQQKTISQDTKNPTLLSLEKALLDNPDHPKILLYLALFERHLGNLSKAMGYLDKLVNLLENQPASTHNSLVNESDFSISSLAARAFGYDLAQAMLLSQKSKNYLNDKELGLQKWMELYVDLSKTPFQYPNEVDFIAHKIQDCLDRGNVISASDLIEPIITLSTTQPNLLALQAQIDYRMGVVDSEKNLDAAMQKAEEISTSLGSISFSPRSMKDLMVVQSLHNTYQLIARAAFEQHQWKVAQMCLEKSVKLAPHEPNSYAALARFIARRAEIQKLYQELMVQKRSPGMSSLEAEANKNAIGALARIKRILQNNPDLQNEEALKALNRLEIRIQAIFDPKFESFQNFSEQISDIEDAVSYVASRRSKGLPLSDIEKLKEFASHPLYLLQIALENRDRDPNSALVALEEALNYSKKTTSISKMQPAPVERNTTPLLLFLKGLVLLTNAPQKDEDTFASPVLEKALEYWPDEPQWHALLANYINPSKKDDGQTDFSNNIFHLEQAIKLDPNNWQHYLSLGKVLYVSKQFDPAVQNLIQALELQPGNEDALLSLAQSRFALGHLKEAEECLKQILKVNPKHTQSLLMRAEISLGHKEFDKAEKFALSALETDSANTKGLLLRSRAVAAKGNLAQALTILENISSHTQESIPLYLERARLIHEEKGAEHAINALLETSKLFPNHPSTMALMAEYQEEQGDLEKAQTNAQQALRIGHNLPMSEDFTEHDMLHNQLGRIMRKSGQLDQAIQHLSEAILLNPNYIEPYLELANVHIDRRQYQDALDVYKKLIIIMPNSASAYYHSGLVYKECKDYENAERMFRQAAKLTPSDLTIQRQLGAVIALNLVHNPKP